MADPSCGSFSMQGHSIRDLRPPNGFVEICSQDEPLCNLLTKGYPPSAKTIGFFVLALDWESYRRGEINGFSKSLIAQVSGNTPASKFGEFKAGLRARQGDIPDKTDLPAMLESKGRANLGIFEDAEDAISFGVTMKIQTKDSKAAGDFFFTSANTAFLANDEVYSLYANVSSSENLSAEPAKQLTREWLACLRAARNGKAVEKPAQPPFPVPRAELEFQTLTSIPAEIRASGGVDLPSYLALASPFGMLDLQVTQAVDGKEASLMKNYYLGITGGMLKIDTAKLANSFHCGAACISQRKEQALKHLQQVRELVSEFLKSKNIFLVAQPFSESRFRVNNTFVLGDWVGEAIPSKNIGFIPSGQWTAFRNLGEYLLASHTGRGEIIRLVEALKRTSFTAIERSGPSAVRVFLTGIGDNVSGLLFQNGEKTLPVLRAQSADGLEYVFLEEVASGVWYFETT